jgi:hypothetical protein
MLVGLWDKGLPAIGSGEALVDLLNNWRCRIPVEVYAQLMVLGFIKDVRAFVDELRPMLYVNWG